MIIQEEIVTPIPLFGDLPSTREMERVVDNEVERAAKAIGEDAEREYAAVIPRRSGRAARSITAVAAHIGDTTTVVVGSALDRVAWLDQGTGIYGPMGAPIRSKSGGPLKFPEHGSGGFRLTGVRRSGRRGKKARYVYTRFVRGIRPGRFSEKVMPVLDPLIEAHADAALLRVAERLS